MHIARASAVCRPHTKDRFAPPVLDLDFGKMGNRTVTETQQKSNESALQNGANLGSMLEETSNRPKALSSYKVTRMYKVQYFFRTLPFFVSKYGISGIKTCFRGAKALGNETIARENLQHNDFGQISTRMQQKQC
ncbi:hypothetical protein [Parendozoicomonas sp. Alg238-R29]|uniref:hypothetical protein n=1 Tax=Parendozoicomonas sp. Alg238-R29 TaxID=2993446 RepID=UPI00248F37A8|nr:hypothetical protein [Parendozoicomonas sp. Alg238-R29]